MEVISYMSIFNFYFLSDNDSNKDIKNTYLEIDVEISGPGSPEFNYKHNRVSKMTSFLLWKHLAHDVVYLR